MTLTLVLAMSARAADAPSLWTRGLGAVTVHPLGVVADVAFELRAPVLRFGGVAFNDTFVGAGVRLAATPVHFEGALRLSVQPIDLLPIDVELLHASYWESPWGLVPADSVVAQNKDVRSPLYDADRDFAGSSWALSVSPTLQIKVGPVVAFSNPAFTWISMRPVQTPEPWLFEPYRGLVMAYDDRLLEHTSAILWEAADGEDRPVIRIGPVLRGKSAAVTGDHSLTVGGLAQVRPGHEPTAPSFLLLVASYVGDTDFPGAVPYVAGVISFERDVPLSAAPP